MHGSKQKARCGGKDAIAMQARAQRRAQTRQKKMAAPQKPLPGADLQRF
jgi:hypothetical protein